MKFSTAIGTAVLGLILPAYSLSGATRPVDSTKFGSLESPQPVKTQLFEDRSNGWYWVYEGVAQGQHFVATGTQLRAIRLRVAQLNDQAPSAPLEIEVRSPNLQNIYVRATIAPQEAGRQFTWIAAQLEFTAPIEEGKPYVLLLHSKDTHHDAPWLVSAAFRNAYPDGRHLGYPDDLMFSVDFARGKNLVVGPPLNVRPEGPLYSGRKGGKPMPTRPSLLSAGGARIPEARFDPLGPIPEGQKVVVGAAGASR